MLHAIKKVVYIRDYKLKLTFRNKDVKIVDLEKELWGSMFEPLKDVEYFKKVKTDNHTIVWPNEVDFCPDYLYELGVDIEEKETSAKSLSKRHKQNPARRVRVTAKAMTKKRQKK